MFPYDYGSEAPETLGTVYVVDDDDAVRDSLKWLLEASDYRVELYDSGESFIAKYDPKAIAVLVLDVRMPGMSGLELQQAMEERGIELPVIFLTGHGDLDTAIQSLKRGAVDFLLKPVDDEKLLAAISSAVHKDRLRREGLSAELLKAGAKALSDRERHLLELISLGRSDARIASELGISERTVQGHRAKIYRKFGIHSGKVLEAMLPDIMRLIGR